MRRALDALGAAVKAGLPPEHHAGADRSIGAVARAAQRIADEDTIAFSGNDDDVSDISETEWRFRDGGLEFRGDDVWWRYIPVTEEFLVKALQIPPPFFEGIRQGANAGGYVYSEEPIVPGHLPVVDRAASLP